MKKFSQTKVEIRCSTIYVLCSYVHLNWEFQLCCRV